MVAVDARSCCCRLSTARSFCCFLRVVYERSFLILWSQEKEMQSDSRKASSSKSSGHPASALLSVQKAASSVPKRRRSGSPAKPLQLLHPHPSSRSRPTPRLRAVTKHAVIQRNSRQHHLRGRGAVPPDCRAASHRRRNRRPVKDLLDAAFAALARLRRRSFHYAWRGSSRGMAVRGSRTRL